MKQQDRILQTMQENGSATNYELSKISLRYGEYIRRLRKLGNKIETIRETAGTWRYYLYN